MFRMCGLHVVLSLYMQVVRLAVLEHTGHCGHFNDCPGLSIVQCSLRFVQAAYLFGEGSSALPNPFGKGLSVKISRIILFLVFFPGSKGHHQKYLKFVVILH